MDRVALVAAYKARRGTAEKLTRAMAIDIADDFGVSARRVVVELERCGALKRGAWRWFARNGGITPEHCAQARAMRRPAAPVDPAEKELRQDFASMLVRSYPRYPDKPRNLADHLAFLDVWELARRIVHNEVPAAIVAEDRSHV
jgi:hypothetical protein